MKITSSSTGRQVIWIKGLSGIQKTALCSVVGSLGLTILETQQQYPKPGDEDYLPKFYQGYENPPRDKYDLILVANTNNSVVSKTLGELSSLFATMQSSSLDGWRVAGSNCET